MNESSASLDKLLQHPDFREGELWVRQHFGCNETIFREGDLSREVYVILSGTVRILGKVDIDEQRRVQPGFSDLDAGEVFGELPLFDDQPRSASVMAISDCEVAQIDSDKLLVFLDQHPQLAYPIAKDLIVLLVRRLRKANKRIFSLFAWGIKARGIDQHL